MSTGGPDWRHLFGTIDVGLNSPMPAPGMPLPPKPAEQVRQQTAQALTHPSSLEGPRVHLPIVFNEQSFANSPISARETERILLEEFGLQERIAECCALANLRPEFLPLTIETATNHGVQRMAVREIGLQETTPQGDRYGVVNISNQPYSVLKINVDALPNIHRDNPDHHEHGILMHELWHLILNHHPKAAAEWLAEAGTRLYATKYGRKWDFICDAYQAIGSLPTGFYIAPNAETTSYPFFHKAVGWAGAHGVLQALGNTDVERLANFPHMAKASHRNPSAPSEHPMLELREHNLSLNPSMDTWLQEIDRDVSGFEASIRAHDIMQPVPDRDTLLAFTPQSRDGCWLMRYRMRRNPAFQSITVPHGQDPGDLPLDERAATDYQQIPIDFVLRNAANQCIARCSPSGRTFINAEVARREFSYDSLQVGDHFWVDIMDADGTQRSLGPFPMQG